jgi:hypothetical protein
MYALLKKKCEELIEKSFVWCKQGTIVGARMYWSESPLVIIESIIIF